MQNPKKARNTSTSMKAASSTDPAPHMAKKNKAAQAKAKNKKDGEAPLHRLRGKSSLSEASGCFFSALSPCLGSFLL